MKRFFLILSLSLLMLSNKFSIAGDSDFNRKIWLQFNPLPLIDYTPRYRFGLSYIGEKKLGYSLALGYGNEALNSWWLNGKAWNNGYSFWEIRPELQYYFRQNNYYSFYSAFEIFYLKENAVFENGSYGFSNPNQSIKYDEADFVKQKYGAHLKLGALVHARPRLDIDFYAGAGVARREIDYSNEVNPEVEDYPLFIEWIPQPYLFEGKTFLVHFTAGFKVNWLIWAK